MALTTPSSLFGIFTMLNNGTAGTGNGFGFGVANPMPGVGSDAVASPFSSLIQPDPSKIGEDGETLSSSGNPLTDAKKRLIAAKEEITKDDATNDLASTDLLVSDLMAVNWNNIKPGDSVKLPNGWSISADHTGMLSLQNEESGVQLPPFTGQQMLDILSSLANSGLVLPLQGNDNGTDALVLDTGAPKKPEGHLDGDTAATKSSLLEKPIDDKIVSIAKLAVAIDDVQNNRAVSVKPEELIMDPLDKVTEGKSAPVDASSNNTHEDGADQKRGNDNTANSNARGGNGKSETGLAPHQRIMATTAVSADLFPSSDAFFVPAPDDAAIAMHSFYNQFGLKEVKGTNALMGSTPLSSEQMQVVIQKLVKNGEPKTLMVRLDPAELGRVQVELTSGSDKSLKAHILVEKPEALHLLKNDMASLEKALSGAGITLDGGSISLDLADQDGGNGSFMQQAFEEMWKEQNEANMAARKLSQGDDELGTISAIELINETYAASGRVNIRV